MFFPAIEKQFLLSRQITCVYTHFGDIVMYTLFSRGLAAMNYQEMLQTVFAKIFSGMALLQPSLERVCITSSLVLTGFHMLVGNKTYLVLQKVGKSGMQIL